MNASEEHGNRVSGTEKTNGLYLDVCGPQGDASRASLRDEGQWPEPYINQDRNKDWHCSNPAKHSMFGVYEYMSMCVCACERGMLLVSDPCTWVSVALLVYSSYMSVCTLTLWNCAVFFFLISAMTANLSCHQGIIKIKSQQTKLRWVPEQGQQWAGWTLTLPTKGS